MSNHIKKAQYAWMLMLKKQGWATTHIAKELSTSTATVNNWLSKRLKKSAEWKRSAGQLARYKSMNLGSSSAAAPKSKYAATYSKRNTAANNMSFLILGQCLASVGKQLVKTGEVLMKLSETKS